MIRKTLLFILVCLIIGNISGYMTHLKIQEEEKQNKLNYSYDRQE